MSSRSRMLYRGLCFLMNAFSRASASLSVFATTVSIVSNSARSYSVFGCFVPAAKYEARRLRIERAFPT